MAKAETMFTPWRTYRNEYKPLCCVILFFQFRLDFESFTFSNG